MISGHPFDPGSTGLHRTTDKAPCVAVESLDSASIRCRHDATPAQSNADAPQTVRSAVTAHGCSWPAPQAEQHPPESRPITVSPKSPPQPQTSGKERSGQESRRTQRLGALQCNIA